MKKVTEMLELLRQPFLQQLENQCSVFKVIGSKHENPKWFQYHIGRNEPGILFIGHSQCSYMFIKLDISSFTEDEQFLLTLNDKQETVYEFFRYIKYDYLETNQQTIIN